jgi:hypothetical protein
MVVWYCMVQYGAPPTPWAAIVAIRWWQLDQAPAEHAQTESVPSALVRRWVSFPQAPAVAELRACAISLCLLELRAAGCGPPARRDAALHGRPVGMVAQPSCCGFQSRLSAFDGIARVAAFNPSHRRPSLRERWWLATTPRVSAGAYRWSRAPRTTRLRPPQWAALAPRQEATPCPNTL